MTTRTYRSGRLIVSWDSSLCYHSARCIKNAPEVFDPQRRPWVRLDLGSEAEITHAIDQCPSGALSYEYADESPAETPAVTISPQRHGPLIVTGHVQVVDADGGVVRDAAKLALCRCGASGNKPYCDGSHKKVGFDDPGIPAEAPGRDE